MSEANGLILHLERVSKTYRGRIRALGGISLNVRAGEVFGLLGPNGAGKSTLVKILMTVVRPSEARGTMLGCRIGDKKSLRRVGYLPEHHRFPPYLSGLQVLNYYGALSNVGRRARRKRAGELLDLVGMTKWGKTKVSKYSKGMNQRLGLAQALINDPEVVFLDEPADGVDPLGRRDIREILKRLRDEGKTVFLNSHLLGEVEMVCDRVSILQHGNVVREGTITDLTKDSQRYEVEYEGTTEPGWSNQLKGVRIKEVKINGQSAEIGEGAASHGTAPRMMLVLPGREACEVQSVIDRLRQEGRTIHRVQKRQDSLEDLFIKAVEESENSTRDAHGTKPSRKAGAKS